jgi:hypothetical protein
MFKMYETVNYEDIIKGERYFIRYSRVDTTNGIDVDGSYPIAQAYGAGSIFGKIFLFTVIMRVSPDLTLSSVGHIRTTSSGGSSLAVFTSLTLTSKKDSVSINSSSGSSSLTAGHASAADFTSSFDLKVSAEL